MNSKYPVLTGEIAKRGIKRSAISSRVGISDRSLFNKMAGKSKFTWEEVCAIRDTFFPDIEKDTLFSLSK